MIEGIKIIETSIKYIKEIEEKLLKGDYVKSFTEPDAESPFPLWIYYDTIKMWRGSKWKNVAIIEDDSLIGMFRISENKLRIKG